MKHLKKFENKNDELWIVVEISTMGPEIVFLEIFDDRKSAENYFIEMVNDHAMDDKYPKDDNPENLIFTVQEAEEYVDNNDCHIELRVNYNNGTHELPEELKIGRDVKKFNV